MGARKLCKNRKRAKRSQRGGLENHLDENLRGYRTSASVSKYPTATGSVGFSLFANLIENLLNISVSLSERGSIIFTLSQNKKNRIKK